MPKVNCPSCKKLLNVGDNVGATKLRCPACKTIFQPPSVHSRPAPAPVASESPFDFGGPAAPSAVVPGAAFRFDEMEDEAGSDVRVKARLRAAADWLKYAAWTQILFAVLGLLIGGAVLGLKSVGAAVVGLLFGSLCFGVFTGVPVTFMLIGSRCLLRRSSYSLAVTGGVFAALSAAGLIVVSLPASLAAGPAAVAAAATLLLGVAGTTITAAVRTLTAMSNPEVKEAFRLVREQRASEA